MKKKLLLGIAAGLFAIATMVSFNMTNVYGIGNVSFDDIAVMAKAQEEMDGGELPEVEISCDSGEGKCYMELEPEREWTPFGWFLCKTVCGFSGVQSDFCINGMEYIC